MELFFDAQNDNNKPKEFRRQQSFLYKTLHPDPVSYPGVKFFILTVT
jgi:hypothetical protein